MKKLAERWRESVAYNVGGVERLQELLGCAFDQAVRVGLCRAPRSGEDLDEWLTKVSEYTLVSREALQGVLEEINKKDA